MNPRSARRRLIVVFGAGVRPDGTASPALARRTGYAAAAAEHDPGSDLFLSGGVGRHDPSEASVMARMLAHSISPARLHLDEASRDTLETVRTAAAFAHAGNYDVLTCTDAYHQPRVRMLFRLLGIKTMPVPMVARASRRLWWKMAAREGAALPYDLVAGLWALARRR